MTQPGSPETATISEVNFEFIFQTILDLKQSALYSRPGSVNIEGLRSNLLYNLPIFFFAYYYLHKYKDLFKDPPPPEEQVYASTINKLEKILYEIKELAQRYKSEEGERNGELIKAIIRILTIDPAHPPDFFYIQWEYLRTINIYNPQDMSECPVTLEEITSILALASKSHRASSLEINIISQSADPAEQIKLAGTLYLRIDAIISFYNKYKQCLIFQDLIDFIHNKLKVITQLLHAYYDQESRRIESTHSPDSAFKTKGFYEAWTIIDALYYLIGPYHRLYEPGLQFIQPN